MTFDQSVNKLITFHSVCNNRHIFDSRGEKSIKKVEDCRWSKTAVSTLEIPEEPEQTLKRPSPQRERKSWLSRDSNDRLDDICLKKRKREEKLKLKKKIII